MRTSVYAIGTHGQFVKFGFAKNVQSRLVDIQVGCPSDLALLASMRVISREAAREIEGLIHTAMNPHILRGEWFKWTQDTEMVVKAMGRQSSTQFRAKLIEWINGMEIRASKAKDAHAFIAMQRWHDLYGEPALRRRFQ